MFEIMKIKIFISLFIVIGLLSSCEKKPMEASGGDINFRFKLTYGDQPFEMFKTYDYPVIKEKFQMTRLSFYISDLTIRSINGDINVKDIDYLNLTVSHTSPLPANGYEYVIKGVKPGSYTSFDFGVGVPKALNALAPKDFKAGHILSTAAEYWSSWKSYIFFRPEGQISINGKPMSETPFALHLGADEAFRKISFAKPIIVTEGNVTNVDIMLDIQKFFNGKKLYDIKTTQQIHSLEQMPLILQLTDNLEISFK